MSDVAVESTSTATESAEPQSTAEIAASVIEAGDQPEPVTQTETPPEATPGVVEPDPDDFDAVPAEVVDSLGRKRANAIPHPRVKAMIDKSREKLQAELTSKYSAVEAEANELRGYVQQLRAGVSGDPKAFLAEIAQADPRYRAFLEPQAPPVSAQMPDPDLPLPDGSRTYSVEGIQRVIKWAIDTMAMPKVDERLKPITEREQQARAQAELHQQLQSRTRAMMAEAQTWPMFGPLSPDGTLTPFQQDVFDAYKADKSLDLHKAYMKVALPRLTEDDNKKRERLLKEMQSAPKRPALGPQQTDTAKPVAQSTADIARSILAADR